LGQTKVKPERHIHPLTGRSWLKLGVEKRSQQTRLSGNNKPCKCHATYPHIPTHPYVWQSALQFLRGIGDSGTKGFPGFSGFFGDWESKRRAAPSSERVDFAFMQISRTLQTAQRFFVFIFCSSPACCLFKFLSSLLFSLFGLFHRRAFVGQAKTKLLLLLSETEVAGGEMGDLRGMG